MELVAKGDISTKRRRPDEKMKMKSVLAAVLAAGLLLFAGCGLIEEPQRAYRSSCTLYFSNPALSDQTSISTSAITASQSLLDAYQVLIQSSTLRKQVQERTGIDAEYRLTVEPVEDTEIMQLCICATDPEVAYRICQGYAELIPEYTANIVGTRVKIVNYPTKPTHAG